MENVKVRKFLNKKEEHVSIIQIADNSFQTIKLEYILLLNFLTLIGLLKKSVI
jgi:hypothetical protein